MTKLLLLTSVLSLTACATDGTEPTGTSVPVAEYVSTTGTTISIYAESDTAFSVGELADRAHPYFALPAGGAKTLSPTQVFQATSSDPVPAAITALTEKMVKAGREFPTTTPVSSVEKPDAYDGCDASTFAATWCHLGDGDPITWCLKDQAKKVQGKNMKQVHSSEAAVCVKSGEIEYEISNGDGGDHDMDLTAGQDYRYSFYAGFLQATWLDYDILSASGTYQFAGEADN
jgi:hypothetical protein